MIEIRNLVKRYGDHLAVDHLNLTLEMGKVYGFLGPNGAGKSTTMNIMTGYLSATEGDVVVNGHRHPGRAGGGQSLHRLPAGAAAAVYGYDGGGVPGLRAPN